MGAKKQRLCSAREKTHKNINLQRARSHSYEDITFAAFQTRRLSIEWCRPTMGYFEKAHKTGQARLRPPLYSPTVLITASIISTSLYLFIREETTARNVGDNMLG